MDEMTTQPVDEEPVEPVEAADPEPTDQGPAADADQADDPGDGHEAARWRKKLRAAEAERDTLRGRLDDMLAGEVARLAERSGVRHAGLDHGHGLAHGSDLLALTPGLTVSALLTETGQVDEAKVEAAVADLLTRRPDLAERWTTGSANGGVRPMSPDGAMPSWGSLLRGA